MAERYCNGIRVRLVQGPDGVTCFFTCPWPEKGPDRFRYLEKSIIDVESGPEHWDEGRGGEWKRKPEYLDTLVREAAELLQAQWIWFGDLMVAQRKALGIRNRVEVTRVPKLNVPAGVPA